MNINDILIIYWLVLLHFDLFHLLTYQLIRLNNSNQSVPILKSEIDQHKNGFFKMLINHFYFLKNRLLCLWEKG